VTKFALVKVSRLQVIIYKITYEQHTFNFNLLGYNSEIQKVIMVFTIFQFVITLDF